MTSVDRNAYFVIHATMPSGFECLIPARGYNLKSWLAFEEKLGSKYQYEEINEKAYLHLTHGDPLCPLSDPADTESKTSTTSTTSPRKRGTSQKKDGSKQSTTKVSAKPAVKSTKKKATSSTPAKKKPTGSRKTTNKAT